MNNNLSKNLKKIRKDNNLSQEELAEELNVSRQSVSKWESGLAYPEMDKIIQICKRFDLNINDLLQNDISEVKSEETSKKSVNNIVESSLKFITDTINLFCNMNFKSKIKCIFEQLVLITILIFISNFIRGILTSLFISLSDIYPSSIGNTITDVLRSLYSIICVLISTGILVYVFKIRYLDYYHKIVEDDPKDDDLKEENTNIKDNKIEIKEEKIIIRDPKHTEYRFINFIVKCLIFCIKICALSILFAFLSGIFFSCSAFVVSFLISKTGLFFIGLLVTSLSSGLFCTSISVFLINFIFNRKNNKRFVIWSLIISIIGLGLGIGICVSGIINLDIITKDTVNSFTENQIITIDLEANKDLYISRQYNPVYIEKDIQNVEIEALVNKTAKLEYSIDDDYLYLYEDYPNFLHTIREVIKELNNNKAVTIDDSLEVKVYASKANIEILKNNNKKAIENENYIQEIINDYEEELNRCYNSSEEQE